MGAQPATTDADAAAAESQECWRRAANGDPTAFGQLYAAFAPVVHGLALARVGQGEAEDVTQDVFLIVHRRLGELRDFAALPGWICSIARNLATDRLRRRRRQPQWTMLQGEPMGRADGDDRELRERMLGRIRALPEAYRDTLVLRLVEGLTGPEIAARTGLTHGSVRVNLTRGMAMLREQLAQDGWP